jgi:hypothetical protein
MDTIADTAGSTSAERTAAFSSALIRRAHRRQGAPPRRRRFRHPSLAVLALAVVGMLAGTASPAMAGTDDQGYQQIASREWDWWNELCLEVDGGARHDGAPVTVDRCGTGYHMRWRFVNVKDGYGQLQVRHTGMCLDVRDVSADNGAQLQQWTCLAGQPNQRWQFVKTSDGYGQLKPFHSGRCLDKAGYNVVQWTCHNGNNQQWLPRWTTYGGSTPPPSWDDRPVIP